MLKKESRFIRNSRIVFRPEGQGGYLYDPHTEKLQYLNQVGVSVYELCDGCHPLEEMIGRISGEFRDVPADRVRGDVDRFLDALLRMDYIRVA
jgi:hypothetical protein